MSAIATSMQVTLTFTLDELAMLGRIVDAGMWELASQPYTPDEERLMDAIGAKLTMPGYERDDTGSTQ